MLKAICFTLICLAITSCKKNTPEKIALEFLNVLYNEHNLLKADEFITDESKQILEQFKLIDEGAVQLIAENNQTIKYYYRIVKEKCRIENDSAIIIVQINPINNEMPVLLRKINNVWKVDLTDNEIIQNKVEADMDEAIGIMAPWSDLIMVEADTVQSK